MFLRSYATFLCYRRCLCAIIPHTSTHRLSRKLDELRLWIVEPDVFERAIVDIFRVGNGKLVEHWDVVQPMVGQSVNKHPMF